MSKKLQPYRAQIDELDQDILDLLAKRFDIVRNVGQLKTAENIKIIQSDRAEEVLNRVTKIATEQNIPADLIRNFYSAMIDEAHKIEFTIKEQQEPSRSERPYGKIKQEPSRSERSNGINKQEPSRSERSNGINKTRAESIGTIERDK